MNYNELKIFRNILLKMDRIQLGSVTRRLVITNLGLYFNPEFLLFQF